MTRTLAHHVCYQLAKAFLRPPLNRFGFRTPKITRFDSVQQYVEDRLETMAELRALFAPFVSFKEKTVLDLGCSSGYLLDGFLSAESFTAIGADISAEVLARGRERYGDRIRFVQSTPTGIPLPSDSIDVLYTVDTVEHLSRPKEMFLDIHRVLKPGGRALIHFGPYPNPYGSHLEDIIPFPWPHIVFSMKTLLGVAARLYDEPVYSPACYSVDERTGHKKPNPYLDESYWSTFLNHITIRQFNRICRDVPLRMVHQQRIGFGGRTFKIGRLFTWLAHVPMVDDFFCNALFTVLEKPAPASRSHPSLGSSVPSV